MTSYANHYSEKAVEVDHDRPLDEVDDIDMQEVLPPPQEEDDEEAVPPRPEEAPQEEARPKSTLNLAVAGHHVEVDNRTLPYVGLFVASLILLIALKSPKGDFQNEDYGVNVSSISMASALFGIYMVQRNMDLYEKTVGIVPILGDLKVGSVMAYFLFVWNFIGTGFLTFNGPFLFVSNGWVAAWALVGFSLLALGMTAEALQTKAKDLGYFSALLGASIIQLCAIIPELDSEEGQTVYSLVISIATPIFILAFKAYPNTKQYESLAFGIVAVLWLVLACFVTFRGPFVPVGNGWFSAWAGCVCSVLITVSLRGAD